MNDGSRQMNEMIRAGRNGGLLGRLAESGGPTSDRAERFRQLTAEAERAAKHGDSEGRALVEHQLDELFAESRASRAGDVGHGEQQPIPGPSFDGGVRRAPLGSRKPRGLRPEPGPADLMKMAMEESARRRCTDVRVPPASRG